MSSSLTDIVELAAHTGKLPQFWSLTIATRIILVVVLLVVARCLYNVFLHPLSSFKGPAYLAASDVPLSFLQLKGTSHYTIKKAHEKYGSVVRIGPNTLSFTEPSAWDGIYGFRKGLAALPKDPHFYSEMLLDKPAISVVDDEEAAPIRRCINAGFSPKVLSANESLWHARLDHLISRLSEESVKGNSVDIRNWFTFSMFDTVSDFVFGENLGCVEKGQFHEWAQLVVDYFFVATLLHQCHKFWPLNRVLALLIPPSLKKKQERHNEASLERVRRRIRTDTGRQDFMFHCLRQAEKEHLSQRVIEAQATVIVLAGSETTASVLTSAIYDMIKHEDVHRKLCDEIRGSFATVDEINVQNVLTKLPYLDLVVKETLRIQPPAANGFTRKVVNQDGHMISGRWIPPSVGQTLQYLSFPFYTYSISHDLSAIYTVVIMSHYCTSLSPDNFYNPEVFDPDRWLSPTPSSAYSNDKREASKPFLHGPRDCPGKAFALNSTKLILARLLWTFDVRAGGTLDEWDKEMKVFTGWMQPPLPVRLEKRVLA